MSDKLYPYRINFTFNGSIDDIEGWLDTYCSGGHSYQFDGVVDHASGRQRLKLLITFEKSEDRELFKRAVKEHKL